MPETLALPVQSLSIGQRVQAAHRFLELGKRELGEARGVADNAREREAAEKVFHALLEILTARVQKYGVGAPTSHEELRKWLNTKGDTKLVALYERAYLTLHVGAYYRGWTERREVDARVLEIEKAIETIARSLKG